MPESVKLLWNRRPIKVLILARVHLWSGQPCTTGPLSSSASRTANSSSLSLGRPADPLDRSAASPPTE